MKLLIVLLTLSLGCEGQGYIDSLQKRTNRDREIMMILDEYRVYLSQHGQIDVELDPYTLKILSRMCKNSNILKRYYSKNNATSSEQDMIDLQMRIIHARNKITPKIYIL